MTRTRETVVPVDQPERVGQTAVRLEFRESPGSVYKCRKLRQSRGPSLYVGWLRDAIVGPDGNRYFLAAAFRRAKDAKGKRCIRPVAMALFISVREARENALLCFCRLHGLPVDHLTRGQLSGKDRRELLTGLGGDSQLVAVIGPTPVLPDDESQKDQEEGEQEEAKGQESGAFESDAGASDGKADPLSSQRLECESNIEAAEEPQAQAF